MAVVESAVDGLALTMPTLVLGLPHNFSQLSSDTDQQIQLHHTHQHYHIDEDQKVQHINSPLAQIEALPLAYADSHTSIKTTSACTAVITENSALIDGIIETPTSADGITSKPQISKMAQSVAAFESLPNAKGELSCEKEVLHTSNTPLQSMYEHLANEANSQKIDCGKAPISTQDVNADSMTQSVKDSMRKLEEHLSKLNPLAKEFVPSSSHTHDAALTTTNNSQPKIKISYTHGRHKPNGRTSKAQREDSIRRTVYVSDIDQQVTEEQLAALFLTCGQVVDCRVCGDPNSVLRFAFVEFTNEGAARAALGLAGTMLGYYPVTVLPSKTPIVPVNPTFLPHSKDEQEMCARTVYCTNIDKKVSQADVKVFFETLCGEVGRLRLLGDYRHSTRIAFVEFVRAECAMAALNCSGAILGSLPLRVSPSKTPLRSRSPRYF
ncbi:hypothetical protein GOP47_0011340 [Adiantum capillus-veneris]|uniref:RRM domain-containing protein n=1 Tax=Adiantum capillus-veneris TaxID=13818 RepID=A0A9D4ZGM6_ADICA|nr:hypothetical protein GOP47_0011340 [Adiantum capillus-veneris]